MSIQSVEVTLPFAGITQAQATIITGTPGITQITSTTAPTDTSVIWIDPETGIQSVYIGGAWVTQLTSSGLPDGYLTLAGVRLTFEGKTLTFTS